jgi:hypothetical protein
MIFAGFERSRSDLTTMHQVCMYLTYSDCDTCVRYVVEHAENTKIEYLSEYHRVKTTKNKVRHTEALAYS